MYIDYEKPFIFLGNAKAIEIWEHARKSQPARDKTFLAGRDLHVPYRISIENGRGLHQDLHLCKMFRVKEVCIAFLFFCPYIKK